jgi:Tol biopolymer transport system component
MRAHIAVVIAGVASVAALTAAVPAAAHPAAAPKPTGTIFFFRENAARNGQNAFAMTAAGRSVHRQPHVQADTPVFASVSPKLLAYTFEPPKTEFVRDLIVASYAGKQHKYVVKGLSQVLSISPNGKYLGLEVSGAVGKVNFEIATVRGRKIATMFSNNGENQIVESWNAKGNEVAVLNATSSGVVRSTLKIYNTKGRVVRTLVKNAGPAFGLAWGANGDVAYAAVHDIWVVKDTGGKPHVLRSAGANFPDGGLSYSPNGAFLAFGLDVQTNTETVEQIWRVTAAGKSPHKITGNGTHPAWG